LTGPLRANWRIKSPGFIAAKIIEQHADAFFAHLGERDAMLPRFVRDEFDAYLRCGRLEHVFLRV